MCGAPRVVVRVVCVVLALWCCAGEEAVGGAIIAKCSDGDDAPSDDAKAAAAVPPYCACTSKRSKGKTSLEVRCGFRSQAVVLTEALLAPYTDESLSQVYVRVENGSSVHVTEAFLRAWQHAPSAAFDVWHCGNLTLDSAPVSPRREQHSAEYRTFAGIGLVNISYIPELPAAFLRDRTRAAFRLKGCRVGVIRAGFMEQVEQLRYLVFDDTVVERVEGPVASPGQVVLAQHPVHTWYGVRLSNVTVNSIANGAFNISHHRDLEEVLVKDSSVGSVGSGAFTVQGDLNVTLTNNTFARLAARAIQVRVTGMVTFDRNVIESWERDALEGLVCHNRTSLESNVVLVKEPQNLALNDSITPFHTSCGNPQIFLVVNPQHQVLLEVSATAAWVLGAVLVLVVGAAAAGLAYLRDRRAVVSTLYGSSRVPILLNGRKTSMQNLPDHQEEEEEGASDGPTIAAAAAHHSVSVDDRDDHTTTRSDDLHQDSGCADLEAAREATDHEEDNTVVG